MEKISRQPNSRGLPGRISSWLDRVLGPIPNLPVPQGLDADRRAAVVLWSTAILLVLLVFQAGFRTPGHLRPEWASLDSSSLGGRIYWASWGFLFYLLIPLAIIRFVLRESPRRYGLRLYLTRRTALVYLVMIASMIPLLLWASTRESFLAKYPFVKGLDGDWSGLLLWETIYVARFVCLEFFFRGFLLFGLEEKLGHNAIAVSVIPYGIMHFAKPFPEALGAVAAGAVLGLLALRTRSIFGGALAHSAIAVSMDLLAIWRQ